ncbi:tctex1 domain-containing protein 2 isoform X3 [Neophocaena asiaeorientalis asiaeorientalis]|uniref:Tctex1 domain-containing protein 2 isoform X3 n=1 Tax=Neophocaena asiaeorientalis asiaeorientalis TaxID=1706337 RepID=A0A341BZZ2_NEOAA|nr:tctex1 domain-containing protein 2 isoform X3 [Neophocaena asiaeorientalis asiaeorientalis]XP_032487582.1 tctex1 domain-containing protein 2 isoform X3 [Phocoena sinus]
MSVAASFSMPTSFSAVEGLPETEKNAGESENTYILRPIFQQRFRPSVVRDCIHAVLKEELANAEYSPEEMPQLTKRLSENIKDKLKEMGFDRYKMVVQVVIGEQRGEGVFPSDLSMKNLECSLEPQPQQHGYSLFLGC